MARLLIRATLARGGHGEKPKAGRVCIHLRHLLIRFRMTLTQRDVETLRNTAGMWAFPVLAVIQQELETL
ncbi:MAG: hypothetical protein CSA70_09035 [Rhodobacterales bacterium]|nr:MAG: hypothetical protein CSA70_09035 [Rhodobacterales bacterium]